MMSKKIVIAVLLVISFSFYSYGSILQQGEVINYKGKEWKIMGENTDKTITLCPYYDYNRYFHSSDWGWFYNNKCVDVPITEFLPKKKMAPKRPKKRPLTDKELVRKVLNPHYLNNLTADEYKKIYARVRNIAVMHPTEQNVAAYMYMTNFTRLKALIFAHAVVNYTFLHPKFNIEKTTGETSWSYDTYNKIQNKKQQKLIDEHKSNLGILVFIKNGCPYCEKQIPVLNWFQSDHHIEVLAVSSNSCPNTINIKCVVNPMAFKYYGIKYEPTTVLVIRQPNGSPRYFPIGVGLTDEVTLFNRAYTFINDYYNPKNKYTNDNIYNLLKEGK